MGNTIWTGFEIIFIQNIQRIGMGFGCWMRWDLKSLSALSVLLIG